MNVASNSSGSLKKKIEKKSKNSKKRDEKTLSKIIGNVHFVNISNGDSLNDLVVNGPVSQ